jgi:DNA-binding CsgD family transcriptional regulator
MKALEATAASASAVVLVEGEAGVGKTRLVAGWLRQTSVAGRRVLIGHCHDMHDPLPFWPVVEALRRAARAQEAAGSMMSLAGVSARAGALQPYLPELAGQLPAQPAPFDDQRAELHRMSLALHEVLGALGPVVLVLEDLHWADPGTIDFLLTLQSDLPPELILVLTYHRADDASDEGLLRLLARLTRQPTTTTISLAPLGPAQVGELIEALTESGEVPDETAALIHAQTGGLPFAVEEVVRLLCDRHGPSCADWHLSGAGEPLGVPPAVRNSLLERFQSLGADTQLAVTAAAVWGPASAEVGQLARVAALPRARSRKAVSEALSAGLLHEVDPGRYACRHELARQAVYDAIPGPERAQFHLRAARALEGDARAAGGVTEMGEPADATRMLGELVRHFKAAGQTEKWGAYAEAAATADLHDERTTARFLRDGLSSPGQPFARRARMARKLGLTALYDTRPVEDAALLQPILADPRLSGGIRGELRLYVAGLLHHAGKGDVGREEMIRAAHELSRRPELAAHAMINLALPWYSRVHVREHLAWLERAMATAQRADEATGVRTATLVHRAAILLDVGDPRGWEALGEIPTVAGTVVRKLELARGLTDLAWALCLLGYFHRAEPVIEQVRDAQSDLGYLGWGDQLGNLSTWTDWATGRWGGLDSGTQVVEQSQGEEPDHGGCWHRIVRGLLLTTKGEHEAAESHLRLALRRSTAAGRVPAILGSGAGLARALLNQGRIAESADVASQSMGVVRSKGIWSWSTDLVPVLTEALVMTGRTREARRVEEDMAAGLAGLDTPAALAALWWCRGALAEADGEHLLAADHFGQAEVGWKSLPRPYDATRAREHQAMALLRHDSNGGALGAERLIESLSQYGDLGADDDVARVKGALKAHGIDLPYPWRGGRRSYGSDLSPQELNVAREAAVGKTNQEIAETLYLSPKTVEHHMSKAMRKLGVRKRVALVAALAPGGGGVPGTGERPPST